MKIFKLREIKFATSRLSTIVDQVGAIRVSEEDKREATVEQDGALALKGSIHSTLLDEEVNSG